MRKKKNQKIGKEIKPQKPAVVKKWYKDTLQLVVLLVILLVTYICFSPALSSKKEFTNWDDPGYVTEQALVKNFSKESIKTLFKPSTHVMLNYHPFTMISLAMNYHFSKLNAKPYALTNIIFHLLNTFLVFVFIYLLSHKKFWAGALSALWFGVHPMHVESVAWIAERKDVLYCFFFLLSCITYIRYLETKKVILLAVVFLLFVFSCLSKAMAVPLPLVLLLIDYYYQRKINFKTIAEKIPFLLLALWIGYNAVKIQATQAIAEYEIFTTLQRLMFAAYGFAMYWVKLFLPLNLSAFYPYPGLDENKNLPFVYSIMPFIALIIIALPFWILYKSNNREKLRVYVFGMVFFILMVALVLQFISVGTVILADRYSYLPYIGAFFILAMFLNNWLEKKQTRAMALIVAAAFSVFFMITCYNRVKIWNNSETLWTNVIEQYPYVTSQTGKILKVEKLGVETAYKNRGNYYREHGMMDKAFDDYNMLVTVRAKDAGAYSNMGNMYAMREQYDKSLEMYSEAIARDSGSYDTYINRGITYSIMGRHEQAKNDFNRALKIKPAAWMQVYEKLAFENLKLKKFDECISTCNDILSQNPNNHFAFFYRGLANANTGKINEAIADLQKSVSLNPDYAEAWFNLSVLLNQTGNFKNALYAAQKAKSLNYAVDTNFLNELIAKAK